MLKSVQWKYYALNQDAFIYGTILLWCASLHYCDNRIASLSKIFPTLMLYKLWEDGLVDSLDDPLEKYLDSFTIKNPLGKSRQPASSSVRTLGINTPALTLRRMSSHLSGNPTTIFYIRQSSLIH